MRYVVLTLALAAMTPFACAATLPHQNPVPGGIAVVPVPAHTTQASYKGHRVLMLWHADSRYAIVGIPLRSRPGKHQLNTTGKRGTQSIPFAVRSKHYPTQRITIKNKSLVTLSKKDLQRVHRESKIINAVYAAFTPTFYAKLPFALPVHGIETSRFGVHRVINGKPRSPHSGIDIAAPAGTPVRSPASGIVATVGAFFFNGNTIIINHGRGLVSVYVHLSKIHVHEGDHVTRGQVIANVGATGRTTGADLHWTVTLNGTKINPELLLSKTDLKSIQ